MQKNEVYIVAHSRTPIGSFGGMLSQFSATDLGGLTIKHAIEKISIDGGIINDVIFGNVLSANLGQAPARQAAIKAGLPTSTNCTTVNKVCASGAKAVMLAAQSIMLGHAEAVVAGGMESMTNAPYYLPKARFGYKYGSGTIVDGLENDGLKDVYDQCAMGVFADKTSDKYIISREEQDDFAINSYKKSALATENKYFENEICKIEILQKDGSVKYLTEDEEFKNVFFDKIPKLKPAFSKDGTVTAANASTINDGASSLVLMSESLVKSLNIKPLARIVAFADAEQDPQWFTTSPVLAMNKALQMANLSKDDIDFFEINEAFSVVPLVFQKLMNVPLQKINVYGGAVSLGHPLGSSGSRILVTLCSVLKNNNAKYGAISICNGGGGASAIIIENI